jgi:hypothetical protein
MAKRPILNKAQDAATSKGAAITSKRVSIIDNPLYIKLIMSLNTETDINK